MSFYRKANAWHPNQPSIHLDLYFALSSPYPELYTHTTIGPFSSAQELLDDFVSSRLKDPNSFLFAIIDKTRNPSVPGIDGALAGVLGYCHSEPMNLTTEIGFIYILPPFQRAKIASTAVALMLQYALEPPERGGLGLRRVQWQANSRNTASRRMAERMGFRFEGFLRWQRIFHQGKRRGKCGNGKDLPENNSDGEDLGRDTVILAICWDDWQQGSRDHVISFLES